MRPKPSDTAKSVDELPRKSHPSAMRPIGRAELRESDEARARRYRVSAIVLVLGLLYALAAFALHSCGR